jgi:hypothetical protein
MHNKHPSTHAAVLDLLELQGLHLRLGLAQVEHVEPRAARVRGVAAALEHLLEAEEVLLALAARVAEVLQALELGELHRDDLDGKERVRVGPVVLVRAGGGDHAGAPPVDVCVFFNVF